MRQKSKTQIIPRVAGGGRERRKTKRRKGRRERTNSEKWRHTPKVYKERARKEMQDNLMGGLFIFSTSQRLSRADKVKLNETI